MRGDARVIDLAPFTGGSRESLLGALVAAGDAFSSRESLLARVAVPPIRLVRLLAEIGEGGIPIETRAGEGHRLANRRAVLDTARVESEIAARNAAGASDAPPWRLLHLPAATSTNDVATAFGDAGEPGGLVVVAETQTRGRGRDGRVWFSAPGGGLWVSLLVRPALPPAHAYFLTIAAALAGVRAAQTTAGVALRVKWPNDLVFSTSATGASPRWLKVGGILAEAKSRGGALDFAVIGIGINVDLGAEDYPPELRERAASLRVLAGGGGISREALLAAFLVEFGTLVTPLERGDSARLLDEFRLRSNLTGERVTVRLAERSLTGVVRDFDASGAILIEKNDGQLERVLAGEATFQEEI
ncbi:MAG: biotin--[acetyl-CoA-carboxylase] ligase [bacterium]